MVYCVYVRYTYTLNHLKQRRKEIKHWYKIRLKELLYKCRQHGYLVGINMYLSSSKRLNLFIGKYKGE